jgi:hypothetical protein
MQGTARADSSKRRFSTGKCRPYDDTIPVRSRAVHQDA